MIPFIQFKNRNEINIVIEVGTVTSGVYGVPGKKYKGMCVVHIFKIFF